MIEIRRVESDADYDAWAKTKTRVVPDEPITAEQLRRTRAPDRLLVLAELGGQVVACGIAGRSSMGNRGFVVPRVLPEARRHGVGTALLRVLEPHVVALGAEAAVTYVDGRDGGSLAFAARFRFEEADRQIEQVRAIGAEAPPSPPEGIAIVSIAERPELLRAAY